MGWEMGWARVVSQYFQLYEGVCNIVLRGAVWLLTVTNASQGS